MRGPPRSRPRPALLGLAALFALAPAPAVAQDAPTAHTVEVGWEVGHFAYIERHNGERFMEEIGALAGPVAAYRYRAPTGLRLFAEAGHWRGEVRYESDDGVLYNNDRLTSLRVGGAIPIEGTGGEVYAGYGYRRWFDGLGAHSDRGGYDRITRYHYLPLGVRWIFLQEGWRVVARAENDFFLYGHNTSRFSQLDQYESNAQLIQDSGWGGRLSLAVEGRVSDQMKAGAAVFFRHWRVDDSGTDSVKHIDGGHDRYLEPRNRTSFYGVRLFARFGAADP